MRALLLGTLLFSTLAFAGPGGECGPQTGYDKSTLGTLDYALNIMKLQDDPKVRGLMQAYRMRLASIPSGMDTDAFKNGAFDRAMFLERSGKVQKANAQADLFEGLYGILDAEQKQRLHQLMAAHQYYLGGVEPSASAPCASQACPSKGAACPPSK